MYGNSFQKITPQRAVKNGLKKRVSRLSRKEAKLVFNDNGTINSLESQAFRLTSKKVNPNNPDSEYTKTVDIGYFSLTVDKDGNVKVEKTAKNPIAQPVRVIPSGGGYKTSVIVFYRTK